MVIRVRHAATAGEAALGASDWNADHIVEGLGISDVAGLIAALAAKAAAHDAALTGTPTAPTAAPGTNTAQIATMAALKTAIDGLVGGAPGALDTLNELAAALANDDAFAASVTNALALKAPLASPTFTGTVLVPAIAGTSDNSLKAASTAFVQAVVASLAAPGLVLIETKVASASSSITFTAGLGDTYDEYEVRLSGVKAATDDVALRLRVGTGAGPTFQTTGYKGSLNRSRSGNAALIPTTTSTYIPLTEAGGSGAGLGSAAGQAFKGKVEFANPESSDLCQFVVGGSYGMALGDSGEVTGGGRYDTAGPITGLEFSMSSGPIAAGRFSLYALRKI